MSKKIISSADWKQLTLLLPVATYQRLDQLRERHGQESIAQVAQEAIDWHVRVYDAPEHRAVGALTPRLLEVLRLTGEGHSTKQIAAALGIGPKTVEWHRARLLQMNAPRRLRLRSQLRARGLLS